MDTKLAGLIIGMGLSLTSSAQTYHFMPITDRTDPLIQDLGQQLTMNVSDAGGGNVQFTFGNNDNGGAIDSTITRIYFDDAPSNLFGDLSIAAQSEGVAFSLNADPPNLDQGSEAAAYVFSATDSVDAQQPRPLLGINNNPGGPGESLTLSAPLSAGKSFADVIASLGAGNQFATDFLRVGLRVTAIDLFNDGGGASFLDASAGPLPIPEPETYAMLLAGLGLMAAIGRRRPLGS